MKNNHFYVFFTRAYMCRPTRFNDSAGGRCGGWGWVRWSPNHCGGVKSNSSCFFWKKSHHWAAASIHVSEGGGAKVDKYQICLKHKKKKLSAKRKKLKIGVGLVGFYVDYNGFVVLLQKIFALRFMYFKRILPGPQGSTPLSMSPMRKTCFAVPK